MKKIVLVVFLFVISIYAAIYSTNVTTKIYGNDKTSIIKWIKNYDNRLKDTDPNITIAGIQDTENVRIVGYFKSQSVGMIAYYKNSSNNYEVYDSMRIGTNETSTFLANSAAQGNDKIKFVVVSTGNDDLTRVELTVNEKYKQSKQIPLNQASVTVFDLNLPEDEYKSMSFDCKFLDSIGEELDL